MSRYLTAAQVLRLLANEEPVQLDGSADPLRSVLRTAADACEQIDELNQVGPRVLARVAELEGLLARVLKVLEAEPLPAEGGSWAVMGLVEQIRRVLAQVEAPSVANGEGGGAVA